MKLLNMAAAAGLVLASLGAATAADAQPNRGDRYEHDDRGRNGHDDRGRYQRHDNGRHNGWNKRRVRCHTEYRHHRRVRVCR